MTAGREVVEDYRSTGLSLRAHPLAFLRERLGEQGYQPCSALRTARNGSRISIAGLVLVRQMPGSAKGVMFVTLEDEAANANLIVWPTVFERNRRPILGATMLGCRGKVQHASGVTHLIVEQVSDLSADLRPRVRASMTPFRCCRARRRCQTRRQRRRQPRTESPADQAARYVRAGPAYRYVEGEGAEFSLMTIKRLPCNRLGPRQ